PEGRSVLGALHQPRRSLLSANQDTTSAALSPLRRQNPREEPGALAALAGIWAGGEEQSSSLPRPFDAHIHCTMCYLRLRRRLSLLLFAAIRGINVPVFKGRRFGEEADGLRHPGVIVSVFTTQAGAVRYVVEADHPEFAGMLHIFNADQLEPRA